MGQINNLNQSNFGDFERRLRAVEYGTPQNHSAIGRGGMEIYDGGVLNISNGGLVVNGSAQIIGTLNADGTINMTGIFIATGEVQLNGPVTVAGPLTIAGATDITGDTTVTGELTTNGPLHVNGATDISGNLDVDGTLNINGATTLNNDLTVAAGKKITVGGLTLENTGASGGQVNFPGGAITASTALGMLINHGTVEIAGTVVKLSSLPTTTQPANLYVNGSGQVFRSTV